MMQMRDWIIGLIGLSIGAVGLLSLMGYIPFELSRTALLWIAAVGGIILLYAAVVEITNSNIMGTVSLIVALVSLLISLLPVLNSVGLFGNWASFSWLGEVIYKVVLVVEGAFLANIHFCNGTLISIRTI